MSNDQAQAAQSDPVLDPPGRGRRPVMLALIAVNVVVAVVAAALIVAADGFDPVGVLLDGVSPLHVWGEMNGEAVDGGEYWRLVTTMFLHYGVLHLLANLVMLWLAARKLEPLMGSGPFLTLYLLSGLGSATAIYYADHSALTAGASGAVFGLFAALLVVSVRLRLSLWLPAVLLVLGVVSTFAIPGMSLAAHAGGLLAGAILGLGHAYLGQENRRRALFGATALVLLALVVVRQLTG